jgi:hypothetical protein
MDLYDIFAMLPTVAPTQLSGWLVEPRLHPELPLLLKVPVGDNIVVLHHFDCLFPAREPPLDEGVQRRHCTARDKAQHSPVVAALAAGKENGPSQRIHLSRSQVAKVQKAATAAQGNFCSSKLLGFQVGFEKVSL